MLDDTLLANFMSRFITYGNRRGKLWFLDVEDDYGYGSEPIEMLLDNWQRSGKQEEYRLGDLDGLQNIQDSPYFDTRRPQGPAAHQPFWVKSRIACAMDGEPPSSPAEERRIAREYQATQLGTLNGNTCLMNILPLPHRPTISSWPHAENSNLAEMSSKREFENSFVLPRLLHIENLAKKHKPHVLVTFCWRWRKEIEEVFGPFDEEIIRERRTVRFAQVGRTTIALTNDRNLYRNPSIGFCWWLGKEISERHR